MIVPHRAKVMVVDLIKGELGPEREILGDLADVIVLDAVSEDDLVGRVENADAIMMYHTMTLSRKTIERLTRCKLIVRCGVGYDNVDHVFARQRGIPVANVPDYGTEEVADSAIGYALALMRGIAFYNSRLRANQGAWSYLQGVPIHRLRGRVFGIVGLGRIGTAAAVRAKALGMDVAFYDPYKHDGYDKALAIRRVEQFTELLAQVHVLSLHCPLTAETRRMVDAAALEGMPKGSYLVNTSRGAVVDTSAIPGAIVTGRLAGAAIDVFEQEPPAADDALVAAWRKPEHPAHDRVLINPHGAFYSEEGIQDMRLKGAQACRRALEGLPLRNVVNA
jgi:D-3-phosphoglycerate dehydrogenase/C-terminal binding protein